MLWGVELLGTDGTLLDKRTLITMIVPCQMRREGRKLNCMLLPSMREQLNQTLYP